MDDPLMIDHYRGKPVESMSHAELVMAVKTLGTLYNEQLKRGIEQNRFYCNLMRLGRET